MIRCAPLIVASFCAVFLVATASPAAAQTTGRVKIVRMNDQVVEGEGKQLPDGSFEVKTKFGAVVVVQKKEIKDWKWLSTDTTARTGDAVKTAGASKNTRAIIRRDITDEEIAVVLEGISAQSGDEDAASADDPDDIPPTNQPSVAEMLRIATSGSGRKPALMEKDHFALVYTSDKQSASELASRLETIYRWNKRYAEMMGIPFHKPEYKLEMYYFGDYNEYRAYGSTLGFPVDSALGFYERNSNRSCFFDMMTSPNVVRLRERLKEKDIDWRTRQYINNRVRVYMEFLNLTVIQHEASHHIHFNTGIFNKKGDMPRWVTEGLAQMFELPPIRSGGSLGNTNHFRLNEFHQLYGHVDRVRNLKLFICQDGLWQGGQSYSLGWALQNYLYKEFRDKYAEFMRKMAQREDDVEMTETQKQKEFEDLFGEVDDKWIKKFHAYIMKIQLNKSELPD